MKFLADQDVYGVTVRFLIGLGHDVVPVARLGEYLRSILTRRRKQEMLMRSITHNLMLRHGKHEGRD